MHLLSVCGTKALQATLLKWKKTLIGKNLIAGHVNNAYAKYFGGASKSYKKIISYSLTEFRKANQGWKCVFQWQNRAKTRLRHQVRVLPSTKSSSILKIRDAVPILLDTKGNCLTAKVLQETKVRPLVCEWPVPPTISNIGKGPEISSKLHRL